MRFFIDAYNAEEERLRPVRNRDDLADLMSGEIKWTRAVKNDLRKGVRYTFRQEAIRPSYYRPFVEEVPLLRSPSE